MFSKNVLVVCFLLSEALGRRLRGRSTGGGLLGGIGEFWDNVIAKPIGEKLELLTQSCSASRKVVRAYKLFK